MSAWVGLLRGVNVGGKTLRMADLERALRTSGMSGVRSYRATGNILLEAATRDRRSLARRLADAAGSLVGSPVEVFLRTRAEWSELLAVDPFGTSDRPGASPYVTFLDSAYAGGTDEVQLPSTRFVEVVARRRTEVLSWGHRVDGRPGFPNLYVEQRLGVPATTRNWSTIVGVARLWT
jgi:uncharacterized protein (DUF1697 family)